MEGFVYILEDDQGKFYIGSTTDIERRFAQHTSGHTQTTRRMGRLTLRLVQKYDTLEQARSVEKSIKKLKRKDYIKKMVDEQYIKIKP